MRLLIAIPDAAQAAAIQTEMESHLWNTAFQRDGRSIPALAEGFDVVLLHHCLCGMDGLQVCEAIASSLPLSPPRILLISPAAFAASQPRWADCVVEAGVSVSGLCQLISTLAKKPLSRMAAAQMKRTSLWVEAFLDELGMERRLRGYAYTAWLLARMLLSPLWTQQPLALSYAACAEAFGVSAVSVERCVRIAVENAFTRGSLYGAERFFGATVDPERGKPTNRAFLMQAAQQLYDLHSRTAARSPNSREMHHKPAAPTSV